MHYVGLNDYMMKVLFTWMKFSSFTVLMKALDDKACGLMIGLLNMCEVMGSYMYVALVDFAWYCE